nr:unnamed protein product [Callosobruchus chinensis]
MKNFHEEFPRQYGPSGCLPTYGSIFTVYAVLASHSANTFSPYFAGLLGMYCLKEQFPLNATNCSSTVTYSPDHKLVQRVNTWPKENRPFWLINAEQIERHRNTRPGVGIIRSTGATTNTENQAQKAAVQLEQQRDTGVDQEQDMSNQQQRRLRPSDIGSRSGGGHGRGSRALFTPEEVLWDSRASRIRNKSH